MSLTAVVVIVGSGIERQKQRSGGGNRMLHSSKRKHHVHSEQVELRWREVEAVQLFELCGSRRTNFLIKLTEI